MPPTYASCYIGNGFVVVPQYGDPNDQQALAVLTPLFPGREVIGLPSRAIIGGGGSFHCMTQQQPAIAFALHFGRHGQPAQAHGWHGVGGQPPAIRRL